MEKHLLLTVSDQKSSLHGARFLADFFVNKDVVKLTLFYTIPRPAGIPIDDEAPDAIDESDDMVHKAAAKGREVLEEARNDVLKLGFPEKSVLLRMHMRRFSRVKDILFEGERGLYDAIVLGKRGLNWFEEAFDGSVSKELISSGHNCPIWVCRRPAEARKGVLLCIDGSAASYRAAEHTGLILGKEQPHQVKLFVVKSANLQAPPDEIIARGREILAKCLVPNVRVIASAVDAFNPAKAIMREAEKGAYAAVAVARADKERTLMDKLFMGSVTKALFREIKRAALWVIG